MRLEVTVQIDGQFDRRVPHDFLHLVHLLAGLKRVVGEAVTEAMVAKLFLIAVRKLHIWVLTKLGHGL